VLRGFLCGHGARSVNWQGEPSGPPALLDPTNIGQEHTDAYEHDAVPAKKGLVPLA